MPKLIAAIDPPESYVVICQNEDDPYYVWAYNRNATTVAGFVERLIPFNDERITNASL